MAKKASKESVDYGPGHTPGAHCGGCRNFELGKDEGSGPCTRVTGTVEHTHWCKLYVKRGSNSADRRYGKR